MIRILIVTLILSAAPALHAEADPTDRLRTTISPRIVGDVMIVEGRIDSHIYDYLAREAKSVEKVKVIELNSLGGNTEWALEVAKKIRGLGKVTRLSSGHYCASACAYLFAAGKEREAAADTWIGIHGARLGAGYLTTFQGLCFVEMESGPVFEVKMKGCKEFLDRWYAVSMESTTQAFDLMESNGVLPTLRQTYFNMPDDPEWPTQMNVIRKPDWLLNAADAVIYNLVTKVLPAAPEAPVTPVSL